MATIHCGECFSRGAAIAHADHQGRVIVNLSNSFQNLIFASLSIKEACDFLKLVEFAIDDAREVVKAKFC